MDDDTRPFPIQGGTYKDAKTDEVLRPVKRYSTSTIPWWLAEEVYKSYSAKFGTGQSLERLGERGGFAREELLWLLRKSKK